MLLFPVPAGAYCCVFGYRRDKREIHVCFSRTPATLQPAREALEEGQQEDGKPGPWHVISINTVCCELDCRLPNSMPKLYYCFRQCSDLRSVLLVCLPQGLSLQGRVQLFPADCLPEHPPSRLIGRWAGLTYINRI